MEFTDILAAMGRPAVPPQDERRQRVLEAAEDFHSGMVDLIRLHGFGLEAGIKTATDYVMWQFDNGGHPGGDACQEGCREINVEALALAGDRVRKNVSDAREIIRMSEQTREAVEPSVLQEEIASACEAEGHEHD